jgi:gamma-F420-2:alpha-L-glutamate ligase
MKQVKLFKEFFNEKSDNINRNFLKKILFINFDINTVSTPGTENKFARGHKKLGNLMKDIGREKGIIVEVASFTDIIHCDNKILYKNEDIKNFDFISIGLIANKHQQADIILDYIKKYNIHHFCYGTLHSTKLSDMHILAENGYSYVPTLVTSGANTVIDFISSNSDWEYPVVSKILNGSKGEGVKICKNETELSNTFAKDVTGRDSGNYENTRMIQKFIPNDCDYRVLIFNNQIISIGERKSKNKSKEFRNNVSLGGSLKVVDIPNEAKQIALGSAKILNKQMAGVDLIQDKNTKKWYIMEVNSAPQYHYFTELNGVNFPEMLMDYIIGKIFYF